MKILSVIVRHKGSHKAVLFHNPSIARTSNGSFYVKSNDKPCHVKSVGECLLLVTQNARQRILRERD